MKKMRFLNNYLFDAAGGFIILGFFGIFIFVPIVIVLIIVAIKLIKKVKDKQLSKDNVNRGER